MSRQRQRRRRRVFYAGLGLGLGLCSSSFAPGIARADELDKMGGTVLELDTRIRDLDAQLKPPTEPGPEIADRRLIDAQVLYELKNYEASSIILFDLVEKYPKSAAYPEALFYLADSLYLKRDYLSSRRYFEKIVTIGPSNRRYQESLQRLIELSLHTGDYSPVDDYIAKLEGLAVDKQLPSVPYVKGKYFFFRQQYDKALAALAPIGPDHEYYFHALYFIGATQVAQAESPSLTPAQKAAGLQQAVQTFQKLLGQPFKASLYNQGQQHILELAHLALGRIYLDQGQVQASLGEYNKIVQKSDVFNDALYESAWADIKAKEYTQARHQLDLLLLNAPDSPLAPEVKLLVGRLFKEQDNYNPATDAFTKTRDEYAPIQASLEADLLRNSNPASAFSDIIRRNLTKFDTKTVLSPAGAKWVRTENDVEHVSTLVNDEDELKRSLDEADDTIVRLEKALGGPARVNVYPELAASRGKAIEIANQATNVKKDLTAKEALLIAPVAGNERDGLAKLDAERAALDKQLALMPDSGTDINARQQKVRDAFAALDRHASELATQVTGLGQSLHAARNIYRDRYDKDFPADWGGHASAAPTVTPSATYSDRMAALDKRLADATSAFASGDARLGKIKDALVTPAGGGKVTSTSPRLTPAELRTNLDAAAGDLAELSANLDATRRDILDAASTVGVDDPEMQAVERLRAQYDDVLKRQHEANLAVRARLSGPDRQRAEQIESILERVRGVEQKLALFDQHLNAILDSRLKDIEASLAEEKVHVASYHSLLSGYTGESVDVGGNVLADSYQRVAARFYNIVVRADVGIIDVAWALKDSSTRESNRLVAERKRELKLLDDEFKEVLKEQP